ncbi:Chemotaxis protein CheW [Desulfonema magnum]|uniref:Chemotaxis protein CheW n=2 Tax=Desulfonema magnum TaxID=45655 RepID=A0A975BS81_9BACT|nr:Chemotaxis protein CheW [Desulfonema magnum]
MNENHITELSQYLTFTLGREEFALEIARVREVVDYTNITKVPRMPEHLCGVINLRGNVVSVIDLRLKLGMAAIEKTMDTCIVIAEVNMDGEFLSIGILADSVQEVVDLDPSQIEQAPKIGTKLNTECIQGIGRYGDNFMIILDIDRVLAHNELAKVHHTPDEILPDTSEIA